MFSYLLWIKYIIPPKFNIYTPWDFGSFCRLIIVHSHISKYSFIMARLFVYVCYMRLVKRWANFKVYSCWNIIFLLPMFVTLMKHDLWKQRVNFFFHEQLQSEARNFPLLFFLEKWPFYLYLCIHFESLIRYIFGGDINAVTHWKHCADFL